MGEESQASRTLRAMNRASMALAWFGWWEGAGIKTSFRWQRYIEVRLQRYHLSRSKVNKGQGFFLSMESTGYFWMSPLSADHSLGMTHGRVQLGRAPKRASEKRGLRFFTEARYSSLVSLN